MMSARLGWHNMQACRPLACTARPKRDLFVPSCVRMYHTHTHTYTCRTYRHGLLSPKLKHCESLLRILRLLCAIQAGGRPCTCKVVPNFPVGLQICPIRPTTAASLIVCPCRSAPGCFLPVSMPVSAVLLLRARCGWPSNQVIRLHQSLEA